MDSHKRLLAKEIVMAEITTTDERFEKIIAELGIMLWKQNPDVEAIKAVFSEMRFISRAVLHDLESCRREKRVLQKILKESAGDDVDLE
jgi:hypothetical protein